MEKNDFFDKTYLQLKLADTPWQKGTYENCRFENCLLSGVVWSHSVFVSCTFVDCDISLAKVDQTAFQGVHFERCKVMGLRFDYCNSFLFEVSAVESNFQLSSFYQCALKGAKLHDCQLSEVDFSEADLSGASLKGSLLTDATFDRTKLLKCDFRNTQGIALDLDNNQVTGALFDREALPSLLVKYQLKISD